MTKAYLFTGSNIGNRLKNIKTAADLIGTHAGEIEKASSVYESAAWGNPNQEDFLNQALQIETELVPELLLEKLLQIENEMGRERKIKWEPRIIDIDILLYEDWVINEENLIIPHPYLPQRRFNLVPLNEIAGDVVHPVLHKTIRQLLEECNDPLEVSIYNHAV